MQQSLGYPNHLKYAAPKSKNIPQLQLQETCSCIHLQETSLMQDNLTTLSILNTSCPGQSELHAQG